MSFQVSWECYHEHHLKHWLQVTPCYLIKLFLLLRLFFQFVQERCRITRRRRRRKKKRGKKERRSSRKRKKKKYKNIKKNKKTKINSLRNCSLYRKKHLRLFEPAFTSLNVRCCLEIKNNKLGYRWFFVSIVLVFLACFAYRFFSMKINSFSYRKFCAREKTTEIVLK